MSEKDSFKQIQKLSQEQIQTQRAYLNQVLLGELIEMNDEAIKERIEAELIDNPALEEASDSHNDIGDDTLSDIDKDNDTTPDVDKSGDDPFDSPYTQTDDDSLDNSRGDDYDDGLAMIASSRKRRDSADIYRPPVVNEASMYEMLISQVRERDLNDRQLLIAEYIIGEIDDDGLMRRSIPSICGDIISRENEFVTPQEVQEVLEVIQDLEPAGIGATNTRECILLQIEDMKSVDIDAAQLAHTIVDRYFDSYERHHFDKILDALHITEDEFNEADKIIKRTNPRPGNMFNSGERLGNANHITPSFVITADGKKLQLTVLNDIPELQISESYAIEYQRITKRVASSNVKPKDEDVTIKRQYESAANFIMLLRQRQEKLYNIMKTIMIRQQEFFITGDTKALKPLVLKDVAQETGYDASTISRAQQNKWVDTNWGIFPVKYFFVKKLNDNDASSAAIKEIIQEMIDNEDKTRPLSDDKICEALQLKGFDIKRRTVAKYRDSLKIPVARQRKTL